MLSAEQRGRLTVVLVGARNPGNIGAAARAMQDFGFSDLRVVNEFAPPFEAARLAAVGAGRVLQEARRFDHLSEALADCTYVAATTAIGERELTQPVFTIQEGAARLLQALEPAQTDGGGQTESAQQDVCNRTALLFGSEKTGLTNEQLSHATALLTIPLFQPEGRHLSMNLGQAVAVCLYELTREGLEGARPIPEVQATPASQADRERLLGLFSRVLGASGYSRRFPANARTSVLRRLSGGMAASQLEVSTWMGILRQLERWGTRDDQAS